MKKNRIALMLVIAAVMNAISCGDNANSDDETTSDTVSDTVTKRDDLPDVNYNGEEFNMLIRTEWAYEFDVEETGDIVDDAVYSRNRAVEERFGVDFEYTQVNGGWNDREQFLNFLTSSILAGDGEYDMVAGSGVYMVTPVLEGYFLNILDMNNIQPDAKWWSQKCADSLTVNGQLYTITGDIALSLWDGIYVMFFNKQLAEEYHVEDIYALVKNGEWTVDKLYEISSTVSSDLNGDSVYDANDLYGFATSNDNHARVWYAPFDLQIVSRGEDGFMYMSYNSEKTQNALEKLVKLFSAQSSYKYFNAFNSTYINDSGDSNMFEENRVLFTQGYLKNASTLRDMDTDFGIIPLPKYDEAQSEYYTTVHDSTTMICFPMTVNDPDMSALIAEALCVYSYYDVVPKYYDISLKTKSARDTESEEMIDIIRDSVTFDFGALYTIPIDGTLPLLGNMVIQGNTNFASTYASNKTKFETNLENINKAYGKE